MTGLYWHFVDIVWIFLFPLLYLIGRMSDRWPSTPRRGPRHAPHVVPVAVYLGVFAALMVLTLRHGLGRRRRTSAPLNTRGGPGHRRHQGGAGHPVLHAREVQPAADQLVVAAAFLWLALMLGGHAHRLLQPRRHGARRHAPPRSDNRRTEGTMVEIVNPRIEDYLRALYDDGDPVRREMEELAPAAATSRSWGRWSAAHLLRARARHRRAAGVRAGLRLRLLGAALRARGGRGRRPCTAPSCRRRTSRLAEGFLRRAGVWDRVTYHREEATAALRRVGGIWDVVYNDIDKDGYPETVELAYAHLRAGRTLHHRQRALVRPRSGGRGRRLTRYGGRQGLHPAAPRPPRLPHRHRSHARRGGGGAPAVGASGTPEVNSGVPTVRDRLRDREAATYWK